MHLRLGEPSPADEPRRWSHVWTVPGGRTWMCVARTPRGYLVQFPGYAEFEVARRAIVCRPRPGIPASTIRHLLLDQLLPAILTSGSRIVLHASAVAIDGRAIGFVGAAGAGKSTVAGALVRNGASLVADDALVVERRRGGLVVVPSYPGLRLWPASARLIGARGARMKRVSHYSHKMRWSGSGVPFHEDPLPLGALYLVSQGKKSRAAAISARRSLLAIVQYSMMLDATDRATVRHGFDTASHIVDEVRVRRLVVGQTRSELQAASELVAGSAAGSHR